MGYFSNTTFITIARGLEILTICLKLELLHEQGTGSVATKGAQIYQQGPYRADYSNGKVGKVKDLQASLLPSLLKVLLYVHLTSFREFLTNTCINYVRKDVRHCYCAIPRDSGRVHLLGQLANPWKIYTMFDRKCTLCHCCRTIPRDSLNFGCVGD